MPHIKRFLFIILFIVFFLSVVLNIFFIKRGNYINKLLSKMGLADREAVVDYTLNSWISSLSEMNYDADVVFIGDSIICDGKWQTYFPGIKVVNLGLSGDTIEGVTKRVSMISHLNPEKIFVQIGINSIGNTGIEVGIEQYENMVHSIHELNPESKVYIISLLPVSLQSQKDKTSNLEIQMFNKKLVDLSERCCLEYIDVSNCFIYEGYMNPAYSTDGIHLNDDGYLIWAEKMKKSVNE